MITKKKKMSESDLGFIYSQIISILSSKHLDSSFIRSLGKKREEVIDKALRLDIPENTIPFLPVFTLFDVKDLLGFIEDSRKHPEIGLDIKKVHNQTEEEYKNTVSKDVYFIFGVEDGKETQGKPFNDTKAKFKVLGKLPLNFYEVISVAIFRNTLKKRSLVAMASQYKNDHGTEYLILSRNDPDSSKNFVSAPPSHIFYERTGIPSCVHREAF